MQVVIAHLFSGRSSGEKMAGGEGRREGERQADLGAAGFHLCCTHQKLQKFPKSHFGILIVWMLLFSTRNGGRGIRNGAQKSLKSTW